MTDQEQELFYIRKGFHDFMYTIKDRLPSGKILEVGKMMKEGKVYEQYPEFFIDSKELFSGCDLIQLDIDSATEPDICDDIINIDRHFDDESVDAVVLMHVLEHVKRVWDVPVKLNQILKSGGMVFIQTPWNFRFHGPRPDCWRISDDGYEALFGEYFEIVELDKYNPMDAYLHPLMISVILKKK